MALGVGVSLFAPAGGPRRPAGRECRRPAAPPLQQIADVCGLVVEDGAIVIYARVPRAGAIVGLRTNGQIDGLPGRTSLFVTPGFYQLRNTQNNDGGSFSRLTLLSTPALTSIDFNTRGDGKTRNVNLQQPNPGGGGGDSSPGEVRLSVYSEGMSGSVTVTADNFVALRREHPWRSTNTSGRCWRCCTRICCGSIRATARQGCSPTAPRRPN